MRSLFWIVLLSGLLAVATAAAEDEAAGEQAKVEKSTEDGEAKAKGAETEPPPWGLGISVKTTTPSSTLIKDQNLTYTQRAFTSVDFSPSWSFNDHLDVEGSVGFSKEWFPHGNTILDQDTYINDVALGISSGWEVPDFGTKASIGLELGIPTSRFSRAESLLFSVTPSVSLTQQFKILSGLSFGLSGSVTRSEYEFTTGSTDGAEISCSTAEQCERLQNTGVRNARYVLSASGRISLKPVKWLSLGVSGGVVRYHLYGLTDGEATDWDEPLPAEEDMLTVVDPSDTREYFTYGLSMGFNPIDVVSLGIGASSTVPQFTPDQGRYTPFFNRQTNYYATLRLDVAAFVSRITEL
ncbi:hypothetical protein KKF91_18825 [Myxococcota bacterium]|nr:hypothetical protein [Myxococcota bacterium]MBU1432598.1 hypothetical protein [Myxococcota bacterium]MBU1896586.1 hypothetical protein [Myxococcota bacterium]